MTGPDIITFISDSGWAGGYAAVCEAIVARVRPQAKVFHVSHLVPVGDVAAGALILERIAPLYPPAVHLAVVDPGVGTGRRHLALIAARGDALVGPDNGLLLPAADSLEGLRSAWVLDPSRVRAAAGLPAARLSSTFHGRDVFAPTAALLASDLDPSRFASPLDPDSLTRLPRPLAERTDDGAVAEVIEVDRFGNVGLAIRFDDLPPFTGDFIVRIEGDELPDWQARVVRTYGELHPGELGVFCDSWGQAALSLNSASAAQLLSLRRGMKVRLTVPNPCSIAGSST